MITRAQAREDPMSTTCPRCVGNYPPHRWARLCYACKTELADEALADEVEQWREDGIVDEVPAWFEVEEAE